jgi:hypothetical protein
MLLHQVWPFSLCCHHHPYAPFLWLCLQLSNYMALMCITTLALAISSGFPRISYNRSSSSSSSSHIMCFAILKAFLASWPSWNGCRASRLGWRSPYRDRFLWEVWESVLCMRIDHGAVCIPQGSVMCRPCFRLHPTRKCDVLRLLPFASSARI